jgi:hypothetical protein
MRGFRRKGYQGDRLGLKRRMYRRPTQACAGFKRRPRPRLDSRNCDYGAFGGFVRSRTTRSKLRL